MNKHIIYYDTVKKLGLSVEMNEFRGRNYVHISLNGYDPDGDFWYRTKGLSDVEPAPVNCTFTQTRYVANMCHGKVVELINKHIVNIKTNTIVYDIPLYTRYDANI